MFTIFYIQNNKLQFEFGLRGEVGGDLLDHGEQRVLPQRARVGRYDVTAHAQLACPHHGFQALRIQRLCQGNFFYIELDFIF